MSVEPAQEPTQSALDPSVELSDATLWQAVCRGESAALGQLYDRHSALVYGTALKLLSQQEAEDLTQDIFLRLSSGSGYNPERGSLRTYLAILTRSRAIDRLRSQQSKTKSLQKLRRSSDSVSIDLPAESLSEAEQSVEVKAALDELTAHQREILQLAYYEGMTQQAIAQRLNMPLGTVKTRARRALLKLREVLRDYGN